jgi:hypothetical protein
MHRLFIAAFLLYIFNNPLLSQKIYSCENKYDAEKKIFFTDNKYDADLLICVIKNKYDAGWRVRTKMHLLF